MVHEEETADWSQGSALRDALRNEVLEQHLRMLVEQEVIERRTDSRFPSEAGARERFLRQVPENARTLELARQRWDELSG
ncbi:hypothetical protein ACN28I_44765 [Archangium gephyra]|uniref:hypothetical protein n=1 Tax=Archangium gephyra TaxID=48 RepID=UPI003B7EA18F